MPIGYGFLILEYFYHPFSLILSQFQWIQVREIFW
jgi:hypothetical protein